MAVGLGGLVYVGVETHDERTEFYDAVERFFTVDEIIAMAVPGTTAGALHNELLLEALRGPAPRLPKLDVPDKWLNLEWMAVGGAAGGLIDAAAKSNEYANPNGRNEQHGDGGRAESKSEKQLKELNKQLENAVGRAKERIRQTIKNVKEAARRKKKGENHSRTRKGS